MKLEHLIALMSTGDVGRYHMNADRLLRPQTTGQHAYNVALILMWMCGDALSPELLKAGLLHDAGERWVGDVPGPTKKHLDINGALEQAEVLELQMNTDLTVPALNDMDAKLLRIADALEGCVYCRRELDMGNTLIAPVLRNYSRYLGTAIAPANTGGGWLPDEVYTALLQAHHYFSYDRKTT
jgi:5'-deoxynucleotidase YfbR-like HD superfamily hydrolase